MAQLTVNTIEDAALFLRGLSIYGLLMPEPVPQ
jgi:hypothetical protein